MQPYTIAQIAVNVAELMACIAGFLSWNKIRKTYWRWFPIYLALIVVTEVAMEWATYRYQAFALNSQVYQYWGIPLQFYFLFYLFHQFFRAEKPSRWPLVFAGLYFISWVADLLYFSRGKYAFASFSYSVGNVLLLLLILLSFFRFANSRELVKFRESMHFWLCIGVMIFYLGTLPFYGLRNTLYLYYEPVFWAYYYCQFGLNCLMYGCFTIAFIWGKPK